jgi:dihydrofolate synthase / folylpolyglutamate synthase
MADFARSADPAVQAQLDRLAQLSLGGDQLGLDRITALLDRIGRPQDRLPPIFHVAGTNGKGSTCAFLRSGIEASGRTVHMFTSPHLVRFNERIRLAGKLIEDAELAPLLGEVLNAGDGIRPTFFEATTATALLAFERTPADACIVEVGLGGRLDATNVIQRPAICGIASLGIDHRQFLGDELIGIAREKAGIAKRGVPLVFGDYADEVAGAVARVGEAAGAPLYPAFHRWHYGIAHHRLQYRDGRGALMVPLPELPGPHQVDNCALALAMLRHQDAFDIPLAALKRMPLEARWPARMQRLGPGPLADRLGDGHDVWIDGGHNPSAALSVADHVRSHFDGPLVLLFASLANKDPEGMLAPFVGVASEIRTVPIPGHEHREPAELAEIARGLGFDATPYPGFEQAFAGVAAQASTLVFGSLYLAGQVLAANGEAPD